MTDKWLNLLGLARRAGKVAPGENQTSLAMRRQTASLLILAQDAGPSLYRKYHLWVQDLNVPLVRMGTKSSLGRAIGMGPHAVLAILDKEFGERILKEMRTSAGGIFLGRKGQGQDQGIRTGQRAKIGQSSPHRSVASVKGGEHQKPYEHGRARSGEDGARHHGGKTSAGTQTGTEARSASRRAEAGHTQPARVGKSEHGSRRTAGSDDAGGRSQHTAPAPHRPGSTPQRTDGAPKRPH